MSIRSYYNIFLSKLYTVLKSRGFKSFGSKSRIRFRSDLIIGEKYIEVGCNTVIGNNIQITAWDKHNGNTYSPSISIGSNCQIGSYNHITAIKCIIIGNGVLTGKFVTITDNSHGETTIDAELDISPIKRPVHSKGSVVIGDNVWIGDKATVLGNVKIGNGSIIGANAVVTKDIPPYSIVGGNPAHIIRKIK